MKVKRKIIEIDEELCDGCAQCILSCAEGALKIVDGKAKVISDRFCDGLGACLEGCPTGALRITEREAEEFDEEAVEEHLARQEDTGPKAEANRPFGGCPSARIHDFRKEIPDRPGEIPDAPDEGSRLTHWPVQIMLIPPNAPFLRGADLLVAADCVPVAFPTFHRDFLEGKAVMMGCPKLDNASHYVDKFAEICKKAGLKSVTTVVMEVPCCAGLPMIVKKGMKAAGVKIPMEEVVVSTRGKILRRTAS